MTDPIFAACSAFLGVWGFVVASVSLSIGEFRGAIAGTMLASLSAATLAWVIV